MGEARGYFSRLEGSEDVGGRRFETRDVVRRIGVIAPHRVHIQNHPIGAPVAVFNPSVVLEGDRLMVYARIILGYYMYASAIALLEVLVDDVLSGRVSVNHYTANIVVYPSSYYDIWGAEDPRASELDGQSYLVYTGRTVNYFNPAIRRERTLPIVARLEEGGRVASKIGVFTLGEGLRDELVSDKDAFLARVSGSTLLFHRPHMARGDEYYLTVSEARVPAGPGIEEVRLSNTRVVLEPAPFEHKLGWSAPLVEVEGNKYIAFIHSVEKKMETYRVFCLLLSAKRGRLRVSGVTPFYIMEPKEPFEMYGDRPMTIYPCGCVRIDDSLVITYGAADFVTGFGLIGVDELLSQLE